MRRLSSLFTFFCKFISPVIWFTVVCYAFYEAYKDTNNGEIPLILIALIIIPISISIYLCDIRNKRVYLERSTLHVSNYIHSIEVDISEIESVHGSILLSPELVWFKLRNPTKFGSTIFFMPKLRFHFGFTKHPIVEELRELAGI